MTREEALRQADDLLEALLRSGDEQVFLAVRSRDGTMDHARLAHAAMLARVRLADRLMAEANAKSEEP